MDLLKEIEMSPTDTRLLRECASQQTSLAHYERIHRAAKDIDDLRMKVKYVVERINNTHLWSHVNAIIEEVNKWEV